LRLKTETVAAPIAVLIAAMFCFQLGAVVAKGLFPIVGAAGTTALRMGLASLMLLAVWRPWRLRPHPREIRVIVAYGLALGCMNFCFYMSLRSIPLGIAVALEFGGPLALAMAASRRAVDFVWILMAAVGLLALLPIGLSSQSLDVAGAAYALAAGVFWALYIFFGRKAGAAHGGQTTALGMVVAAIVIVPIGAVQAGTQLLSPSILPAALGVAVLSSALPYSLEMLAMPQIADANRRRAHERWTRARCAVGPAFLARALELDPMGGDCQHHGRLGRQRGDESQTRRRSSYCRD
jgi:inner membrane transporter RhtA